MKRSAFYISLIAHPLICFIIIGAVVINHWVFDYYAQVQGVTISSYHVLFYVSQVFEQFIRGYFLAGYVIVLSIMGFLGGTGKLLFLLIPLALLVAFMVLLLPAVIFGRRLFSMPTKKHILYFNMTWGLFCYVTPFMMLLTGMRPLTFGE